MTDIETIFFGNVISSAACVLVLVLLWRQNHERYEGLGLWLWYAGMQATAMLLIALRGRIPDILSVLLGNGLLMGGTVVLYGGLRRFLGQTGTQIHNYILLVVFLAVHAIFTFLQPSLNARNINVSAGTLLLCLQSSALMLFAADADMRAVTRPSGGIFVAFCLISAGRIVIELAVPPENDFLRSGGFNALALLLYQILTVILAFSLFLMVNRRLILEQTREIAERKRAEEGMARSLAEKEVLLRELYHRTKNNMQVISSMLVLEAGKSRGGDLARILNDMDGRIRSMALVHQKLYQSHDLSRLDLKDYLRELAALMQDMFQETRDRITVNLECQSVPILVDTAIPLGLIAAEVLTNALRHAFPGDRKGVIRVRLAREDSGLICLEIADNGVGIADGTAFGATSTLGMRMIQGIARHQLGATVSHDATGGVTWRIAFADDRYSARVGA